MAERIRIVMVCEICESRNYKTSKKLVTLQSGKTSRFSMKKYCKTCNGHTVHLESK